MSKNFHRDYAESIGHFCASVPAELSITSQEIDAYFRSCALCLWAGSEELGGDVVFLMVHEGAAVEDGKDKVTEGGYTFPVVFDTDSSAGALYGITAFPTTFFIDKDGNLQAYYMGAMDANLLQQGISLIYEAE